MPCPPSNIPDPCDPAPNQEPVSVRVNVVVEEWTFPSYNPSQQQPIRFARDRGAQVVWQGAHGGGLVFVNNEDGKVYPLYPHPTLRGRYLYITSGDASWPERVTSDALTARQHCVLQLIQPKGGFVTDETGTCTTIEFYREWSVTLSREEFNQLVRDGRITQCDATRRLYRRGPNA